MIELVSIGKLTKTHALKGALKMRPFNVNTDFFNYTDTIFLKNKKDYKIKKFQLQNGIIILTLDGVNSIEEAELLKGQEVFINKKLIQVDDDEILLTEMIGFEAIFNKELIGKVSDFADYNAGLIYVVENDKEEKYFLPENDDFIEKIDYDLKKIFFKNIEELLEWYTLLHFLYFHRFLSHL